MAHSLIIGGTRGLGRSLVRMLDKRGDTVSVIGRQSPPEEDKKSTSARYWLQDLQDSDGLKKILDEIISTQGLLNYLIFCQRYRGSDDDWEGEFRISIDATRNVIDSLLNKFKSGESNGMVAVSSVFGEFVGEGQALSYHVGKAGLNQLMRYYAVNCGHDGIRSNIVTTFTYLKDESKDFYLNNHELHDLYKKIIPVGKLAAADDIANVIAFLCSPEASFINGQNIYVDGGLSLVWPETLARKLTGL